MSLLVKKCCHCRSDLEEDNKGSVKCDKCVENEKKYGQPTTCVYCQLPAAFLGGKCVYCSASERKLGTPVPCANCRLRAAFTKPNHKDRPKLCRMCVLQARANKLTMLAGVAVSSSSHEHHHRHHKDKDKDREKEKEKEKDRHKRRHSDHKDRHREEPSSSKSRRDPLMDSGENVLLVQQLRDQIGKLNSVIQDKDIVILEKDKKIAALQADMRTAEKRNREKFDQFMKEKEETIHSIHEKYRSAIKKGGKKANNGAETVLPFQ
ncbi:unnamed protein product [Auanema sp. JU1783]|nr:unnamed protein product [Auanema sp. JU1783]